MPKTDPITGCSVMTVPEFWASEARAEGQGRTGSALMADFYAELDAASAEEEARLRDPAHLLPLLQEEVKAWNEADPEMPPVPGPVAIIEVLDAHDRDRVRSSTTTVRCRVRDGAGKTGVLTLASSSYAGDFYEPPSTETNIAYEADPP